MIARNSADRASRVAWVTGASSGIGRVVSLELAKRGWRVAASARRTEALDALAREPLARRAIESFPLDVTDQEAVRATFGDIEARLGPVGLVVLAAGTHVPVEADGFSAEPFRRLLEVNVMGVVHVLEAALPRLVAERAGRIAVVSSVAGYRGLPTAAAYGASKAALINMMEALKFDLDRHGVGISIVNPGFVRTPLTDRNPFPMPFLVEAEDAARRIVDGLERGAFEIAFPRRLVLPLKLLRALPASLYFPLVRRFTGW